MSGHVFHPGHDELHGVTVVVEGRSGRCYVGRYHEQDADGLIMNDVGILEADSTVERDAWLARQFKFGVRVDERHLVVPRDEVQSVRRFADFADR